MRSMPAAEKSLEYGLAARWPKKTRTPMAREPDSFSVSTWPSRTTVENSSPSRTTHSAAVAPPSVARRTTSVASSLRSVAGLVSLVSSVVVISNLCLPRRRGENRSWLLAKSQELTAKSGSYCMNPPVSRFAAGADAFIEFQIVADHRNPRQHVGSVADQGCALDRGRDLSVFDEVGFRRRENKFAIRDVDLPAAEVHRVNAILHRTNDVPGIVLPGEHVRVRHARHRNVLITLAASVARIGQAHQSRREFVAEISL